MKIVKLTMVASIMGLGVCQTLQAGSVLHVNASTGLFADDEKTEFKKKLNMKIDELDEKIDNFKAGMKKSGNKADATYDKEVENLKESRNKLKNKLKNFKEDSKDNWVEFKKDIENESDKFQNEVEAFIKKRAN